MKLFYFDNNATTPVLPEVFEAMRPWLSGNFGNPSSGHSSGRKARDMISAAREDVASLVSADPSEVIFLSGGTESDNLAVKGGGWLKPPDGKWEIAASEIEHPAVLNSVRYMGRNGYRELSIPVDRDGIVDLGRLESSIGQMTALVSIMHSNNETGTIEPISDIARTVKRKNASTLLHTDAVQSAGKVELDVGEMGVDLLSLSAHKIYGPKGVGALYVRKGMRLEPLVSGGGHERGLRGGTENVAGIAGFGAACRIAKSALTEDAVKVRALRDKFETRLAETIPGVTFNCRGAERLPGTSSVTFDSLSGESLFILLDLAGIEVSTGSACSSGSIEPSHVLTAIGLDRRAVEGTIRFSFGKQNTQDELDHLLSILPGAVETARKKS